MKSNNQIGNPYHDDSGKFTSSSGNDEKKPLGNPYHNDSNGRLSNGEKLFVKKQKTTSDPLMDFFRGLAETMRQNEPPSMKDVSPDTEKKLAKMGFGNEDELENNFDEIGEAIQNADGQEFDIGNDLSIIVEKPKGYRSGDESALATISIVDNNNNVGVEDIDIFSGLDDDYKQEIRDAINNYLDKRGK